MSISKDHQVLTLKTVSIQGLGTLGKLYHNETLICRTTEAHWDNNKRNISCVPAGRYQLVKDDSKTYGMAWHLSCAGLGVYVHPSDMAIRYSCVFHAANWPLELKGCIAPGDQFIGERFGFGVLRSAITLRHLTQYLDSLSPDTIFLDIERHSI